MSLIRGHFPPSVCTGQSGNNRMHHTYAEFESCVWATSCDDVGYHLPANPLELTAS